jgi:hypothetical protein
MSKIENRKIPVGYLVNTIEIPLTQVIIGHLQGIFQQKIFPLSFVKEV